MKTVKALIIDDEAPARRRIWKLLEEHSEIRVAGEAESGRAAVRMVRDLRPELLFLDIQMPGRDGFQVLRQLPEPRPVVVFVTAYDQYALRAFEEHAVDYLLKPYDRERFDKCVRAALRQVRRERSLEWESRLRDLLSDTRKNPPAESRLKRIPVKTSRRVYWIDARDVLYLQAAGKYVEIHSGGKQHLVRKPLGQLADALGREIFLQIHRSFVVNLDKVSHLKPWSASEYLVVLEDGTELLSGRTFKEELQQLISL